MPLWNWICPSGAIPACHWKPAAPIARYDAARMTCWNCTAPPRSSIGTATRSPGCSAAPPTGVHLFEGHVGGGFGVRGELYPEDLLVCARRLAAEPPGQMDRGPARAHGRHQPFPPAAPSHPRSSGRRTAVLLAIDDVFFHDQGAYVRTHGARVVDLAAGHAAGPVPPAGLSRGRAFPPDQQDPRRHLSRALAGSKRRFVRERLMDSIADRIGVWTASISAAATWSSASGDAATPGRWTRWAPISCWIPAIMPGLLRQDALARFGWDALQTELTTRRARRRACVGAGHRLLRGKERLRPIRRRAHRRRPHRPAWNWSAAPPRSARGSRRSSRRSAPKRFGVAYDRIRVDPWPYRPDRIRQRRPCVPRDGDVRLRHLPGRAGGPGDGTGRWPRNCCNARPERIDDHRRPGGARRSACPGYAADDRLARWRGQDGSQFAA